MKDTEFKAKNNDINFQKQKKADTVIGRVHQEQQERTDKSDTTQKRNKKYQHFSNIGEQPKEQTELTEKKSVDSFSETSFKEVSTDSVMADLKADEAQGTEQKTEPQTSELNFETAPNIQNDYVPDTTQKSVKSEKHKSYKKAVQRQQIKKANAPDPLPPPKAPKNEQYNFQAAASDEKEYFDRSDDKEQFDFTTENNDFQFERKGHANKSEHQSSAENKPKTTQKKNAKYQREQKGQHRPSAPTEQQTPKAEKSDFQFTRTRYDVKADKLNAKYEKAYANLPTPKKQKRKKAYDEQKKKTVTRLQFEKEVITPDQSTNRFTTVKNALRLAENTAFYSAHQSGERTDDNSALEAADLTAYSVKRIADKSIRTKDVIRQKRLNAPYQKAQKLKVKAEKAEINALYQKALKEHPEMKKSAVKKFVQKQRIKKQYQKAKRAEETAKKAKRAAENTKKATARIVAFIRRHKGVFAVFLIIGLIFIWLGSILSSCSIMGTTGGGAIMVSSYFANDEEIYAAEDYYIELESELQSKVDNIEREYPNYDEYNYNIAGIGHNPYELISYLTAVYQDFKFNDIKGDLETLFNSQYHLRITETSERRTDSEGNTYTYRILNVTVTNNGISSTLNAEQLELYNIYLVSKGNRDYLFEDDIYSNITQSPYNDYTIPSEALSDSTFRTLITEAERYLGYPYVWGGSSPSTSFDCSGFVCWVYKNSGVYPLSRTTAQGIFNQCSAVRPSEAKPGDLIFFTGTYATSSAVTHIGIYAGNGMMIHCGNPIQYASVNSSYWSSHFYAYGRLPIGE